MQAQYVADRSSSDHAIATSTSQAVPLVLGACQNRGAWAMVCPGRTQAVLTSHTGRGGNGCAQVLNEELRSRGCRRARRLFWHWVLWRSPQLVRPRKKKWFMWTSQRLRLNQPTPASTSNLIGRAFGAMPRPALFLSADTSASCRRQT